MFFCGRNGSLCLNVKVDLKLSKKICKSEESLSKYCGNVHRFHVAPVKKRQDVKTHYCGRTADQRNGSKAGLDTE